MTFTEPPASSATGGSSSTPASSASSAIPYSVANSNIDLSSGTNLIQVNSGKSNPGGCQFGCDNGGTASFTIDIGTNHLSGNWSASGDIAKTNCIDGTVVTVILNASARKCHFNWW